MSEKHTDSIDEKTDFSDAIKTLEKGLSVLSAREGASDYVASPYFAEQLTGLMMLVLERNESIDLTSITEPKEFVRLHLLDSLACVGLPEVNKAIRLIDVGCGAGFPGLPLAALYPEKHFLLIDSLRKRIEFVDYAVKELNLKNVEVRHLRAETAGRDTELREQFDLCLCRAVGKMSTILEYSMPFVRVGGSGIFYKTVPAEGEIQDSLIARQHLGCSDFVRIETYKDILPERRHALYIVEKSRVMDGKYPRREGVPSRVPL